MVLGAALSIDQLPEHVLGRRAAIYRVHRVFPFHRWADRFAVLVLIGLLPAVLAHPGHLADQC
jgi:hypothetical protein